MKIVASIAAADTAAALERARIAAAHADIVEYRLDLMKSFDLKELLSFKGLPAIITVRPKRKGGGFKGTNADRLKIFKQAIRLGAEYIDVETGASKEFFALEKVKIIESLHDSAVDFGALREKVNKLLARPTEYVKIAVVPRDITECVEILAIQKEFAWKATVFASGIEGIPSRLLGRKFGAELIYGCVDRETATDPGQLPIAHLKNLYRVDKISPETKTYGVVGGRAVDSIGPTVLNRYFAEEGVDAVYIPFQTKTIGKFIHDFSLLKLAGLSVTMPFKEAISEQVGMIDDVGKAIGCVNTISIEGDFSRATNTDAAAIKACLEKRLGSLYTKHVGIIGAGGAAKAAAYAVKKATGRVSIINRSAERGLPLAKRYDAYYMPIDKAADIYPDAAINCTPIGSGDDAGKSPVGRDFFRSDVLYMDLVVSPRETEFLRLAREAGARTIEGAEVWAYQAAAQLEYWFDRPADANLLHQKALETAG